MPRSIRPPNASTATSTPFIENHGAWTMKSVRSWGKHESLRTLYTMTYSYTPLSRPLPPNLQSTTTPVSTSSIKDDTHDDTLGAENLLTLSRRHINAQDPLKIPERGARQTAPSARPARDPTFSFRHPGFSGLRSRQDRSYPFCPAVPRLGSLHLASPNLLHSPTQMLPAGFSLSRQSIYTETLCNRHHLTTEMALFGDSSSTDWAALAAACLPRLVRRTGVKLT